MDILSAVAFASDAVEESCLEPHETCVCVCAPEGSGSRSTPNFSAEVRR